MLDTSDGSKYSGKFTVDGVEIGGELTFAGSDTRLLVHHHEFFRPDNIEGRCVHGVLRDLTRVSLFGCLAPSIPARSWSQHLGEFESANIQPHFVLHGRRHLSPGDKLVRSISFVLKDAAAIFPDFMTFSTALNVKPGQLRDLLGETQKVIKRRILLGKRPEVMYFTGRFEIFKAKTVLGTISAEHHPSFSMGGPNGVHINNTIGLEISFPKLLIFDEALRALLDVLPFFEIIAGRRQEVESVSVRLKAKERLLSFLSVYWCSPPQRKGSRKGEPQSIDLPIDATRTPKAFATVLANWLERHEAWKVARSRFSASFSKENNFDTDRLIGAANMFDLLPSTAVPKNVPLSKELKEARDASRALFKVLPETVERESVLGALGRVGHATLKRKVRHRAGPVVEVLGTRLPHLLEVLDLAVDARNHFVHGTETKIDYVDHFFDTVVFLSLALEFTFAVSDLLEAGWDIQQWLKQGTTMSHPLAQFLYNYGTYLQGLRDVLPDGHKLKTAP